MRLSMIALALLAVLPLLAFAAPASATDGPHCEPRDDDYGFVRVQQEWWCKTTVTIRQCDVEWYGGRGLLGGFVIENCQDVATLP